MAGPRRRSFGWLGWVVAAAVVGGLIWRELTTPHPPAPPRPTPPASPVHDAAVAPVAPVARDAAELPDAPPQAPLYTIPEALDDLASGPLKFFGTGEWFGLASIHACAYRNDRVIVVNEYCTVRETPAFGLVVISPTRGHVTIYAEAESAISTLTRADYFTFNVDAQVPFREPIELSISYADLRAWDERRYHADVPACWLERGKKGCTPALASQLDAWSPSADSFIETPPAAWYALVKDFHARAVRDSQRKPE